MKFRKKPVVIEAVQIKKGMLTDAPEWFTDAILDEIVTLYGINDVIVTVDEPWAEIETLEGRMHGDAGDWIIRGIKGELYPCKPDIFEATYEKFEEDE